MPKTLARGRGDGNLLLPSRAKVFGISVQDAVGIYVKGDLYLGYASRGRGYAHQLETAQGTVIPGHGSLSLEDVDVYGRLAVGGRGEYLFFTGRYGGIPWYKHGHNPTQGLYAQGERGNVQQEDVPDLSA